MYECAIQKSLLHQTRLANNPGFVYCDLRMIMLRFISQIDMNDNVGKMKT